MARRDADPRPEVEVLGVEAEPPEPTRVEVGGGGRRRQGAIVLAAVGLLLIGGLALGNQDDQASRAGKEERDNRDRADNKGDRPTTTTTATTETTDGAPASLPGGAVFAEPTGAAVLLHTSGSRWSWIDLDTGTVRDVRLQVSDQNLLLPVRGGVVTIDGLDAELIPLPDGEPVTLGPASEVRSSGDPDTVWLLRVPGEGGQVVDEIEGQLVDLTGAARSGVVTVPADYVLGATRTALVFVGGGRIYEATDAGVRPLAVGDVVATLPDGVLVRSCDDAARCRLVRFDSVTDREIRVGDELPSNRYGLTASAADANGTLAVFDFSGATTLTLYDHEGRTLGSTTGIIPGGGGVPPWLGDMGGSGWLPGDLGLLIRHRAGVARVFPSGGALVTESIAALDGLGDTFYVIPG